MVNIFIEFFTNFSEYILLGNTYFFSFHGNKMHKFYHILLTRCEHLKGLQKLFLNFLQNFRKLNMMEYGA